jgi:nicotinamidase-related amidase
LKLEADVSSPSFCGCLLRLRWLNGLLSSQPPQHVHLHAAKIIHPDSRHTDRQSQNNILVLHLSFVVDVDHDVWGEPFTPSSFPLPSITPEISSLGGVATMVPELEGDKSTAP